MLFHFLNFSQFVVCMFGHKNIYKVTNLKVHFKGRYLVKKKKKSLFKNYNERLVWITELFSCICDITKIIPPWRERLFEHCTSQAQNLVPGVFISLCF